MTLLELLLSQSAVETSAEQQFVNDLKQLEQEMQLNYLAENLTQSQAYALYCIFQRIYRATDSLFSENGNETTYRLALLNEMCTLQGILTFVDHGTVAYATVNSIYDCVTDFYENFE